LSYFFGQIILNIQWKAYHKEICLEIHNAMAFMFLGRAAVVKNQDKWNGGL
jgi:hypothetical protein